mmetsp:Transcript_3921/g.6647  ORF Transcript_3921/g.6647 Transcript_3921/m.6647 type:complete len:200 (+) Transcript_3921:249-848(+)
MIIVCNALAQLIFIHWNLKRNKFDFVIAIAILIQIPAPIIAIESSCRQSHVQILLKISSLTLHKPRQLILFATLTQLLAFLMVTLNIRRTWLQLQVLQSAINDEGFIHSLVMIEKRKITAIQVQVEHWMRQRVNHLHMEHGIAIGRVAVHTQLVLKHGRLHDDGGEELRIQHIIALRDIRTRTHRSHLLVIKLVEVMVP